MLKYPRKNLIVTSQQMLQWFYLKINNKPPIELAEQLAPILKDKDKLIETVTIAKPGFINIKFKKSFWANFTKEISDNSEIFGINQKEKRIIILWNLCLRTQQDHCMLVIVEVQYLVM